MLTDLKKKKKNSVVCILENKIQSRKMTPSVSNHLLLNLLGSPSEIFDLHIIDNAITPSSNYCNM